MGIEMKIETITPDKAVHYLKRNVDNYRKISKRKVQLYAEEMKAGKWQLNGEAIVFDQTGRLKNGQHRLAAIVAAGVPIKMTVVTGVADDVVIFDNGMNRTTMQMARASGCGDISDTETAVATMVVGEYDNRVPKGTVIAWLLSHDSEINHAFRVCGAQNKRNIARKTGCVLATYIALNVEEMKSYDVEMFFKIFNTGNTVGTDGYEPSSALVARRMFEERYKGNVGLQSTYKRRIMEQVEILLMALSDFNKGKARQLNYKVGDPMRCEEMMKKLREAKGLGGAQRKA